MISNIALSDEEFARFQKLMYEIAGVTIAPQKKPLVSSRLTKRLNHYRLSSYGDYFNLAVSPEYPGELQVLLDLLTTHETYFYREPKHFHFLEHEILKASRATKYRVWSAACSSGEEPYTLAMVLDEFRRGADWEVVGSDVSQFMVESAQRAVYPMTRLTHLPKSFLHKYCLKGKGKQEGMVLIDAKLRKKCQFSQLNLMHTHPHLGKFDAIFLRNVMIYFDAPIKRKVIANISKQLVKGGYLFIGHSESLNGITQDFETVRPSIYRFRGASGPESRG